MKLLTYNGGTYLIIQDQIYSPVFNSITKNITMAAYTNTKKPIWDELDHDIYGLKVLLIRQLTNIWII